MDKERRYYRIEIYTPNNPMSYVEYYSTYSRVHLREFINDVVDMIAWKFGGEEYRNVPSSSETEEEFIDRYASECGIRIFDIPIEEYRAASCATFDCKTERMLV